LSQIGHKGSAGASSVAYPLLMECDRRGRLLWLSDQARSTLVNADNLVDAIPETPSGLESESDGIAAVYFLRLLEHGDRVLLTAQYQDPADRAARALSGGLMHVQGTFLEHYFRLQNMERTLSTRTRQLRRGGARPAVVQIELERQRLGRELHTGVGQVLAAIRLQLEIIAAHQSAPPPPVQEALGRIATLADQASEQVRSVSRRLHPPEWQRLPLAAAIQQMWNMSGIPQQFEATLHMQEPFQEPALEVKVLMYRAAQEALSNFVQHSHASRISMRLEQKGALAILRIEDNGIGFDAQKLFAGPASIASGIGLRSIRDQAASLGGKLAVESGPEGTRLQVAVPITPAGS